MVENVIYRTPSHQIIVPTNKYAEVTGASIHTLQDGQLLDDEIINCYLFLLQKRAEKNAFKPPTQSALSSSSNSNLSTSSTSSSISLPSRAPPTPPTNTLPHASRLKVHLFNSHFYSLFITPDGPDPSLVRAIYIYVYMY